MRVTTTLPLLISGSEVPAGTELEVNEAEAASLRASGRAEPLHQEEPTDALPEPAEPTIPAAAGDQPPHQES